MRMYEDIALSKSVRIKRAVKEHIVLSEPTSTDEYQDIVEGMICEGQLYNNDIDLNEETNRKLLLALDSHDVDWYTQMALRILPHVILKPNTLVALTWDCINLNDNIIRIRGHNSIGIKHVVPMSTQVVGLFKEIDNKVIGSKCKFIFCDPNNRKCVSSSELLQLLMKSLPPKTPLTPNLFRSIASRVLNKEYLEQDIIRLQMGFDKQKTGTRMEHLAKRRKMMQFWSDYIDELKIDKSTTKQALKNYQNNPKGA